MHPSCRTGPNAAPSPVPFRGSGGVVILGLSGNIYLSGRLCGARTPHTVRTGAGAGTGSRAFSGPRAARDRCSSQVRRTRAAPHSGGSPKPAGSSPGRGRSTRPPGGTDPVVAELHGHRRDVSGDHSASTRCTARRAPRSTAIRPSRPAATPCPDHRPPPRRVPTSLRAAVRWEDGSAQGLVRRRVRQRPAHRGLRDPARPHRHHRAAALRSTRTRQAGPDGPDRRGVHGLRPQPVGQRAPRQRDQREPRRQQQRRRRLQPRLLAQPVPGHHLLALVDLR